MTAPENIVRQLFATAAEVRGTPRKRRGHAGKLAAAVGELEAEGLLPPHLRPAHRDRLIIERLTRMGYKHDLPGRDAIRRWLEGR